MHPVNERPTPIRQEREPFVPTLLAALAAPLLWALHFGFVYALEGSLCAPQVPGEALVPAAIGIATLLGAGLCAWLTLRSAAWLRRSGAAALESCAFLVNVQRLLAALALVAILWVGAGALMLGPCALAY